MSAGARGAARERKVRRELEAEGWFVVKAGGSLGAVDLVALKDGRTPLLVQVKGSSAGPYEHFGPWDRVTLLEAQAATGAEAILAWAPPDRRPTRWIRPAEWPPRP